MKAWCVRGRDPIWCATFRGHKPSKMADVDRTACGMQITFRFDSARRSPTCDECKKRVARRRKP